MKKLLFRLMLCTTLIFISGCKKDDSTSEQPELNVDYYTDDAGVQHQVKDGTYQEFYQVSAGKKGSIHVTTNTLQGSVDVKIYKTDDEENCPYNGNALGNADFTVELTESGEYKIFVTYSDFEGETSFDFIEE